MPSSIFFSQSGSQLAHLSQALSIRRRDPLFGWNAQRELFGSKLALEFIFSVHELSGLWKPSGDSVGQGDDLNLRSFAETLKTNFQGTC